MEIQTAAVLATVSEEGGKIGLGEKLAYSGGNFAEMMVFNPATTFMVFFYTDIAGIAAAAVGTLMAFSRVFDLLNPAMGMVVDRTHTRHGKARPWLLWTAIPFGICAVLLFTVPGLGPTGKVIYAFVTYNLALTIIYPIIDVPFAAMLPLMTSDQNQRTWLSLGRMTLGQFGGLVSFAITLPMVKFFGGGAPGWQRSFIVFGVTATILLLLCFFATKERVKPVSEEKARVPIKVGVVSLFHNKYWLLLAVLGVILFLTLGLYGSNIYFCRYFLHSADRFGPLMTMSQAALIVGMLLAGPLLKRLGKRNTALLGMGVSILGQAIMFLAPTSFTAVVIGMLIKGLGISPLVGTMFAMVADTIEYGEWKSGWRTEGLAFGAMALAMKISVGIGNALVGWILGWSGYVNGAEIQPASALLAIKAMFLHIPLVLLLIVGVVLWVYKLDKQYPSIVGDLRLRRSAAQ